MNKLISALCLVWCLSACGGVDPGGTTDEVNALRDGHETTLSQQQSLAFADQLFDFDPTLDPALTADQNVQAIKARVMVQLPCTTLALNGATLTISTPSSGCSGPNGVAFSGTAAVTVVKSTTGTATLTVTLELTNFTLNGKTTSGTMTFVTTNGSTFSTTYALMRDGKSVSGMLTITGSPNQISTTGTLTQGTTSAVFTAVVWKKGDCYPSSGTLAVTQGRITTTYTFTSTTPTTGTVTTGRGKSMQLPAYGSCPPGADAGP